MKALALNDVVIQQAAPVLKESSLKVKSKMPNNWYRRCPCCSRWNTKNCIEIISTEDDENGVWYDCKCGTSGFQFWHQLREDGQ